MEPDSILIPDAGKNETFSDTHACDRVWPFAAGERISIKDQIMASTTRGNVRFGLLLTLALLGIEIMSGQNGTFTDADWSAFAAEYDRPALNPHQSRSAVVAQHGIVATSQPLAAQAGLDVLKAGGNAADAAIAANAVIGLTEPMSCGIGGDLFVIYWDSKTQKLYGLNASGRSPYKLNRDVIRNLGLTEIPDVGPLSWSVPGCVDGWEELRTRFGTLPLSKLLEPAIHYAETGFPVSEIIATSWHAGEGGLGPYADSVKTYLPSGRAPEPGEVFHNPNLAHIPGFGGSGARRIL